MHLYEIDKALEACAIVDQETGEIIELDYEAINALQMQREFKLENLAAWQKSLVAEAEAVKAEKLKLEERQRKLVSRAESLKAFLLNELAGEVITSGRVKVSYHKTKNVVDITDDSKIPADFMVVKKVEPDKKALKAAMLAGEIIDGAQLIDKVSLVIK